MALRLWFRRSEPARPQQAASSPKAGKAAAVTVAIAAAVAIAIPLTAESEGLRTRPYYDPAAILTVCYGETEGVQQRLYTPEECRIMLGNRMSRDYAAKVIECLPQLKDERRRHAFAALTDAAYNTGWSAVCKSRMAVSIRAGNWRQACDGFVGWYTTAKNRKTGVRKELPGLVKRRVKERDLCIKSI